MAYEVHLKEFDGPLDLLLHLIEQAKVDIKDIFISEITNQYLSLMEELDELDMDTASEFLTMAATLVYIKSRSLLPKPPKEAEEEEDPEEALVRQLKEYKLFKQAGEKLNELSAGMRGVFSRLPQEYELEQATAEELFAAFMDVLNREEPESSIPEIAKKVDADKYTVRTQLVKIRAKLKEGASVTFEELFEATSVKLEKIVTFMALLEMIARQEILLKQSSPYGRITITAYNLKEDDADAEYMDE
jgi:segregation and condensation protein A